MRGRHHPEGAREGGSGREGHRRSGVSHRSSGWHAQGAQGGGEHVVVADEHDQLDAASLVLGGAELRPERVVEVAVLEQRLGDTQEQGLALAPAGGGGAGPDPREVVVVKPGSTTQPGVVVELVVAAAHRSDAQDDQLGVDPREPPARHQPPGEVQPAPEQPPVASQRGEDPRRTGAGDPAGEPAEQPDRQPELASPARRDRGARSRVDPPGPADLRQDPVGAAVEHAHGQGVRRRERSAGRRGSAGCRGRCRPSTGCGVRP